MRWLIVVAVAGGGLPGAAAQTPAPPISESVADRADQARTADLNRGILERDAAIAATNAKAAADYAAERARYEAALAANDVERAKAAQAARDYNAARKAYEAEPARIAAGTRPAAKPAATRIAAAAPRTAGDAASSRMICRTFAATGSLLRTYRTCKPAREWSRERDNIRSPGGAGGACQRIEC